MRIRIQMRIRILSQPYKIFKQLPYKVLKKTKKIDQNLKTTKLVHIYYILKNKITIITNFFAFFPSKCFPLDPDPQIKCGSGSRK